MPAWAGGERSGILSVTWSPAECDGMWQNVVLTGEARTKVDLRLRGSGGGRQGWITSRNVWWFRNGL